uniref:Snake toxin/toxin-like domain-containing protein n=1 Tax=Lynx canadensis TaxID=61383 RepID=A0A667HTG5_LYNCA
MILFALLLVTDLPRVETNVTAWRAVVFHSGFLPLSAATLKCHVCEIENSFGCTNPSNCPRDFHFCTSVAVSEYLRASRVHRKVGQSFQQLGSVWVSSTESN